MKGSASDALLLKSVKAAASPDQLLQCAHHCLLQEEMCQGFQMQNTTSATCQLFEKICFKDSGHEVYFARSDPIQFNFALGKYKYLSRKLGNSHSWESFCKLWF